MCASFLMYYPEIDLGACSSQATVNSFSSFAQQHIEWAYKYFVHVLISDKIK